MDYATAIRRIEGKLRWMEGRLDDPGLPDRTRHYTTLDCAAFRLALDALKFADAMSEYEAAQKL